MSYLAAGDLDLERFVELCRATPWPEDSLIMAFAVDRFSFSRFEMDEGFLTKTDQGRIFSTQGELRWRRIGDHMRAVYLGESPPDGLEDHSGHLTSLEKQTGEYILWGRRTDLENEWLEQQVPNRLAFPVEGRAHSRGRVALVVESWVDASGQPKFARYHSLKEIEGES